MVEDEAQKVLVELKTRSGKKRKPNKEVITSFLGKRVVFSLSFLTDAAGESATPRRGTE